MKGILCVGFVAVMLVGCVTTRVTPAGENVRITSNPEAVRGCAFLGNVKSTDRMNGGILGQVAAEENASRRLQNAAAEMGANTVFMTAETTGMSGAVKRGEAYRCGQ